MTISKERQQKHPTGELRNIHIGMVRTYQVKKEDLRKVEKIIKVFAIVNK